MTEYFVEARLKSGTIRTFRTRYLAAALRAVALCQANQVAYVMGATA